MDGGREEERQSDIVERRRERKRKRERIVKSFRIIYIPESKRKKK